MSSNIQSDHVEIDIVRTRFSTVEASSIRNLVMNEDRILLQNLGGVEGIVEALETDVENGIIGDASDRYSRRRKFGDNFCPEFKPVKCFKHVALEAFTDPMIIILLVCCALSLVLGITRNGLKRGWHEGLSNLAAILVVVAISAGCNFWLKNLCLNHSDKSSNVPHVDVVRNRRWQQLSIPRLAVGDVVFLKPGDHVPADGLFLDGSLLCVANLTIDGEIEYESVNSKENPFLHYGRWVVDGHAKMLITGVGNHKTKHEILFNNGTLVDEFKNLTSVIAQIGRGAAVLTFLALLVRLFAGNIFDDDGNRVTFYGEMKFIDGVSAMVGIIATPVMMALNSSPEGLMFAVKFTLTYSMRKLDHANVFVRKPSICQSVASVTTICVNKTATLTKDDIKVTKFWLGPSSIEEVRDKSIAPNVLDLLHQGIGLNTSPLPSGSLSASPKNPTEKAIFEWAVEELDMDVETLKESCTVVDIEPFNSTKKQSRVLISRNADKTNHEHRKGAAEVIISMCSHYYELTGTVKVINHNAKVQFEQILEEMAKSGLRCIAFAHRNTSARDYFTPSDKQFNLLGIMGLENPPRTDGIKRTLEECLGARVKVKLITGDNISTAKSVATKCGILESSYQPEEIVEGEVFRNYTPEERLERVETIRVMARATPSDKLLMVQCLKEKGHVVAYLGRGTG